MKRIISIDTETKLIGPGAVTPDLICCAIAEGGKGTYFRSHVDGDLFDRLAADFSDPDTRIVFHNAAFDLRVLAKWDRRLEPLIWEAVYAGRVTDTLLREQLLNLSTCGKINALRMPDGTTQQVFYSLAALVEKYLGLDIGGDKEDPDAIRFFYSEFRGLKSSEYAAAPRGREAVEYACADPEHTLRIYHMQDLEKRGPSGYRSTATEEFQTRSAFSLGCITELGMAADPEEYERVRGRIAEELRPEKLLPLYRAGILEPPIPQTPHARQEAVARRILAEWQGVAEEDVTWDSLTEDDRLALSDAAGIRWKAGKATNTKKREALCSYLIRLAVETEVGKVWPTETMSLDELVALAGQEGVKIKRTDTGAPAADSDVVEGLVAFDKAANLGEKSVLATLQHYDEFSGLLSKELPRMTWEGKCANVIHFPFRPLVETSRTSSYSDKKFPSGNGQNVDPRARPMFLPRPGHVLCSTDYATLELVCVGQTTYDLFGRSAHRDKINAGYDLHAYLGTTLALNLSKEFGEMLDAAGVPRDVEPAYLFFLGLKKTDPKFFGAWRKLAKPVGLGLPGGLGAWKFIELARKDPYFVDVVAMAAERFEKHPGEFEVTKSVLFYAKKLHRMTEKTFRWTPQLKGVALATRLKGIWLDTYPEMREYFIWAAEQHDPNNPSLGTFHDEEGDRDIQGLCYSTPLGMFRAGASFTSVANGRAMQSPAAEGFKTAVANLVRAFRDPASRSILHNNGGVVNEIHDETLTELREPIAHELAIEVRGIMERSMAEVIRDVRVRAEPCLMRRWYKAAEPVFDENGRLIPWEPKPGSSLV